MSYSSKKTTSDAQVYKDNRNLRLDNSLASDRKPVKIGDDVTGLLLGDKDVFVENEPTEEKHIATKKYVDDSIPSTIVSRWSVVVGGYKTNNNSTTNYYTQSYPNFYSWGTSDSSPTSVSASILDGSAVYVAPADGRLTKIRSMMKTSDTGATDPLKFYVYKCTIADLNSHSSGSLTLIGTSDTIEPHSSGKLDVTTTTISSSNSFSENDLLFAFLKKDSTSGNQDQYFTLHLSGELDE